MHRTCGIVINIIIFDTVGSSMSYAFIAISLTMSRRQYAHSDVVISSLDIDVFGHIIYNIVCTRLMLCTILVAELFLSFWFQFQAKIIS